LNYGFTHWGISDIHAKPNELALFIDGALLSRRGLGLITVNSVYD
jgi:hypothetical protein